MRPSRKLVGLALAFITIVSVFTATVPSLISALQSPSVSAPSAPIHALATDLVEKNRPQRVVTQADFVYVDAGARTYVVGMGAGSKGALAGLYEVTTSSWFPKFSALGDFNRDTRDDWFDAGSLTLNVTMSASTPTSPGAPGSKLNLATFSGRYTTIHGLASADWDGDGYSDAILATRIEQLGTYQVLMLRGTSGTPTGQVYSLNTATSEVPKYIAAGDFNADGKGDFAIINQVGTYYYLRVFLSQSTSSCIGCSKYAYTATLGGAPVGLAMGDWDRDGRSDVIVTEQVTASDYRFKIGFGQKVTPSSVQTLTLTQSTTAAALPRYVSAGDWNADGRDDLFAVYQTSSIAWDAKVTLSASTSSSRAAAGATSIALTFYYTVVYAFAIGDWTGDSTRVYYDGFTGSRTFSVPVALLMAPPYEKGFTNTGSAADVYAAGTLRTTTYTGSVRVGAAVAFSFGACACLPFGNELEAKVEVEVEGGVTVQLGFEQTFSQELSYTISGTVLDQGPVVIVVDIPYLDYQYQIVNKQTSSVTINVDKFVVSIPSPFASDYVMRPMYLSEYNDPTKKPKDMPTISDSTTHKTGNLRSYLQDDQYTGACAAPQPCWASATAQASNLGSGNAVFSFLSGTTIGWGVDMKISIKGEITAKLMGISVGMSTTWSLGVDFMAQYTYSNSMTIGGKAGELLTYDTDIYSQGYEKFGYQYNAYVRKVDFPGSGQYPAVAIMVLDWKTKSLNEGYPVVPSVTGVTKTSISLSWTLANDYIHSAGYVVHWSTRSSFSPESTSSQLSRDVTSFTITGLTGGKTYYIKVQGLYTSGFSNFSVVLTVTTPRK